MAITGQWEPMPPIILKKTGLPAMEAEADHTLVKVQGKLQTIKMDSCGIIVKRNGVSYRTYGEFIGDNGPNIPVLKDHFCKDYYTLGSVGPRYCPFRTVEKGF